VLDKPTCEEGPEHPLDDGTPRAMRLGEALLVQFLKLLTHEKGSDHGVRLDSLWHGKGAASNKRAIDVAVEIAMA